MRALHIHPQDLRYKAMIGTGGIGSGSFFELRGNHTLGREESRGGRFLDPRDYCKLHIIAHYVATLLGPGFETIPIGMVGEDDVGARLLAEMRDTGMDLTYVASSPVAPTLFSFCFVYPDGTGGNLTTDDSASSKLDPARVTAAEPEFLRFAGRGLALAAPEVPLDTREAVLDCGTRHRFLRVASFTTEEMAAVVRSGLLHKVDLLAVNLEEAAAAADIGLDEAMRPASLVERAIGALAQLHPDLTVSVTAGPRGSWSWDGSTLTHVPRCEARVASTAGAGDAHLAGLMVGLAAGLALPHAQQLATLVAGLSVTSPHTIAKEIDRESLREFARECRAPLSDGVRSLLEG